MIWYGGTRREILDNSGNMGPHSINRMIGCLWWFTVLSIFCGRSHYVICQQSTANETIYTASNETDSKLSTIPVSISHTGLVGETTASPDNSTIESTMQSLELSTTQSFQFESKWGLVQAVKVEDWPYNNSILCELPVYGSASENAVGCKYQV